MEKKAQIIGVNALFLVPNAVGGTEYHLRSFVKYLQKLDTTNSYVLFCNRENYDSFELSSTRWKKVLCPIAACNRGVRLLYEQLIFPWVVRAAGCTVLHSYGYFGPIITLGIPHVVTVHDVNWKDHPEDNSWIYNAVVGFLIEQTMQRAHMILTDSEFGKSRLLTHFPQYSKTISVIEPGVDDAFLELLKTKSTSPLGTTPYLLCVSAFYPHKRVAELIEWWKTVQNDAELPKITLVIIGKNGRDAERVQQLVEQTKRTTLVAKVSYPELVRYYQHAVAVIHPSAYEGFGYPVYEAVAAGKRVFVGRVEMYGEGVRPYLISGYRKLPEVITKQSGFSTKTQAYAVGTRKLIEMYRVLG
jgi:glycosyltransferase involved in cell wall biosynthesis